MHPAYKAYFNQEYDRLQSYKDDILHRKPSSTPEQLKALRERIAERKANGTLGKVPFVLEKVSKPFQMHAGDQWYVELTLDDGIIRRVSAIPFANEEEAKIYAAEMQEDIGKEVSR